MIIKFYCEYCKFGTNLITDMKRHIKMKKHIKLSNDHNDIDDYKVTLYRCDSCKNTYKSKSSLATHAKTHVVSEQKYSDQKPPTSNVDISDISDVLRHALDIGKEHAGVALKMIELCMKANGGNIEASIYKKENEYHKRVAENAGKLIDKSMNMLTYAMTNFSDAPRLEYLDKETARNILKYESKDGEIISRFKDENLAEKIATIDSFNRLPEHLGNNIVTHYRKKDQTTQSLWVADASRMKFIMKDDEWKNDNKGVKISKQIINPLLDEVINIMENYRTTKADKINEMSGFERDKYAEVVMHSLNIQTNVRKGKTNKDIIKYIIPYLLVNGKR
jgi:hypothetical protein